jgi:alkanesulfonate monooxygenase SsuD/methylene tetrahydromethanopterin reductase-like flavin-dependent oxidoreductase (luciferase family)
VSLFVMRFDLRNPPLAGTSMTDRYAAALEMAEFADQQGFVSVTLSEHHGSPDGYLPSALAFAAAIAARTQRIHISIAAVVASFHDPLRLAEDAAVVDRLSGGRLSLVIANGYVPAEFAMFGRELGERAARTVEAIAALRQAWTGEPFEYRGRMVRVTPTPHQRGGPPIALGGSSEAAARRAARLGVDFMPTEPGTWAAYREEALGLGRPDPGECLSAGTRFVHLARDPEAGWAAVAPYALHETNAYGAWLDEVGAASGATYRPAADAGELRGTGQYRVLTPDGLVSEVKTEGPAVVVFHPMMGGLPPALAWDSLRLFEREVRPRL